jgi:tricorn protease
MLFRVLIAVWVLGLMGEVGAEEIPAGAVELRLVATPALSPDGERVVFEWMEDLWLAPSAGGEAVRVDGNLARDAFPQFRGDGKRIVFSSERSGSMQIFSIPVGGGDARQHTHHSEGNELESLSPDGKWALVRGMRERAGLRGTRLLVVNLEREAREERWFDAAVSGAAWSPEGGRILVSRGGEQRLRQGYVGSRAGQIWQYEVASRSFAPVVAEPWDARSPLWLPDGRGFYCVSGRDGTGNLWWQSMEGEKRRQLTHYKGDGVVRPAISADGEVVVFRRGFEFFRFRPGTDKVPVKVKFWTREPVREVAVETRRVGAAGSADFTMDLKQVVFAAAGELWWIREAGEGARRLTETAEAEESPRFSVDGKWLYFSRDDGLAVNFFRSRFEAGELRGEEALTRRGGSRTGLKLSADGRRMAWVEERGDVWTAAVDGSEARRIFQAWDRPTYDWSPCGEWLAVAAEDGNANRDIWLAAADGRRAAVNVTRHPAFEGSPRWSPDGRFLVFSARRGADGRSEFWRMDMGRGGLAAGLSEVKLRGIGMRARRLDTGGIEPTRAVWAADGKSLLFQNQKLGDASVYGISMEDRVVSVVGEGRCVPLRVAGDGSLLCRVGQEPAVMKDGELSVFPVEAEFVRRRDEVLRLAFRRVWRALSERFYDPGLSAGDWEKLRLKYEPEAVGVRSSRQFDHVMSLFYGELNASHLSLLRTSWRDEPRASRVRVEKTAHPGLVFREGGEDAPLVVARVLRGSPISEVAGPPRAGEAVVRIGGEAVGSRTPLHRFFNGAEGRPLPVVLRGEDGVERVVELRCISYARARSLDEAAREREARRRVAKAGKVVYLSVSSMSREAVNALELEIYRTSLEAEGLVLDLRDNGGGREADRMLAMFSQAEHAFTVPRGGPQGYPHARRVVAAWTKPVVVLCNQNTYSNSEIFCHAIQQAKRAPLVGTATAGGVISAVKTSIPDAGELQIPFRGWFDAETGEDLELRGARPDFPVDFTLEDEAAGRDPQLEKALEILKKAMSETKRPPAPRWSER